MKWQAANWFEKKATERGDPSMFLHLGAETVIETDNILGIFDLDTTTVQKSSREYLNLAEKAGRVVNVSPFELPKSFVVTKEEETITVYLSQLSSNTLLGRLNSGTFSV
ncbi:MAG: DUF370 domain-containing protein [Acutalibacteraceae bacterium]|nr:DUF370 domain-containing protein [Acutalibacteraceae bacterium]